MRTFVGTSGYSYKEWKGSFFPDDLPASKMLGFYAARFNTVEINNTFYRMPAPAMVAKWAEQVPEAFVFALKAPQSITHRRQLNDAGDAVAFFWKTARELGPKLGPVLFQMPPFFKKDLGRLRDFLRQLPEDCRAACEFPHRCWCADAVYDVRKTGGEPGRVPELESGAAILRQLAQKISQPAKVLLEEGRHLEQDGPKLRTQLPSRLQEEGDRVAGIVQLAPMGDALGRFEREDECLRNLLGPLGDHRWGRHPVEGVVDLDGVEPGGVEAEHFRGGQVVRKE